MLNVNWPGKALCGLAWMTNGELSKVNKQGNLSEKQNKPPFQQWFTLGILELGTYSRCFFRNISLLFANGQKIITRPMEVFIPLNRNIYPVSISLWASCLESLRRVTGMLQVSSLLPKDRGSEMHWLDPAGELPIFFSIASNERHTQVRTVAYNVDISVCTDQSSIKKKRWDFCYNKFDSSIPSLSWRTKHLVKGKVKLEGKNTGGNYFGVRINFTVR